MFIRMKRNISNLSLRIKLHLISIIGIVTVVTASIFGSYHMSEQYNKELYEKSISATSFVVTAISSQLQQISILTDGILGDSIYQSNLSIMNDTTMTRTEILNAKEKIYRNTFSYLFSNKNIESITFVLNDFTINCGAPFSLPDYLISENNQMADHANGQLVFETIPENNKLLAIRQLKQTAYLRLKPLATLYITIDFNYLIKNILESYSNSIGYDNFIILNSKDEVIYPLNSLYGDLCKSLIHKEEAYLIKTIDGKRKFITQDKIDTYGWRCFTFTDYESIFQSVQSAKLQNILITLSICFIAIIITSRLSRELIQHFYNLIIKMKEFEKGVMTPVEFKTDYSTRKDEIGDIHRRFDEMVIRISDLINDNYLKQILIKDTQIRMLEQQIDPHFLYNTLESINLMALCRGEEDIALMARSLGNLFRISIKESDEVIPLSRELDFLSNYIQIQSIRFHSRLKFVNHIEEAYYSLEIPKMSIQPLVENAIKHAMDNSDEICEISLQLEEHDNNIILTVSNTGSSFDEDFVIEAIDSKTSLTTLGVGLTNIHSRIRLIYGEGYGLTFQNKEDLAVVTLTIPKKYITDVSNTP